MQIITFVSLATARVAIDLAVKPNAEGLFLFGGTAEASARNWVPNKPNAVWTGTPTLDTGEVTFDPASAYLTTGIADSVAQTWILVSRSDEAMGAGLDDPYYISTNTGTSLVGARSIFGASLRTEANTEDMTLYVPRYDGVDSQNQTITLSGANVPPVDEWSLLCARFDNGLQKLDDIVRAKSSSGTVTVARDQTTNKLRIGGRYGSTTGTGTSRQAGMLIYSSALSDGDMALAAAQLRALVLQRGITIS